MWGTNIDGLCGINDQPARRQAVRQEAANAMDTARAHLLLQVRVQALNDDLHATFERWYPALRNRQEEKLAA
jgi:hypothetical protein